MVVITEKRHVEIIEGFPLRLSEVISRTPRALVTHGYFVDPVKHEMIECFHNSLEIVQGLDRSGNQNKLLVIQSNAVTQAECMTWNDQISKLIIEGEWIKAFCLIIDFMEQYSQGKISPHSESSKKLFYKIESFIIEFADFALKSIQSDSDLEMFCGVAMDYCVSVGRNSLLFTKVFDRLKAVGGREIFFKLLEPYILNERILSLPAEFLHGFVEYLVAKNQINSLEQIILHLSPNSFDFDQIIRICRDYQLFTGLCYVHNNAFKHFGAPICDMYDLIILPLFKQLEQNKKNNTLISRINQKGYHLLLYLNFILNGTTFPWCQTLKTPTRAKQGVLNILFNTRPTRAATKRNGKDQSTSQTKMQQKYDILRFLIDLDLKETLNCLEICFDDKHLFAKKPVPPPPAKSGITSLIASPNDGNIVNSSSSSSSSDVGVNKSPGQRMRRTSVQIKDMLFNAQSAVVSSAKWAWSTSVGYVGQGGTGTSEEKTGSKTVGMNAIEANRGVSSGSGLSMLGSEDPTLDYSLDASITIPNRQEMMDILVNIVFVEKSQSTFAENYDINKMNQVLFLFLFSKYL